MNSNKKSFNLFDKNKDYFKFPIKDINKYKLLNPDLKNLSDREIKMYYLTQGIDEKIPF